MAYTNRGLHISYLIYTSHSQTLFVLHCHVLQSGVRTENSLFHVTYCDHELCLIKTLVFDSKVRKTVRNLSCN